MVLVAKLVDLFELVGGWTTTYTNTVAVEVVGATGSPTVLRVLVGQCVGADAAGPLLELVAVIKSLEV